MDIRYCYGNRVFYSNHCINKINSVIGCQIVHTDSPLRNLASVEQYLSPGSGKEAAGGRKQSLSAFKHQIAERAVRELTVYHNHGLALAGKSFEVVEFTPVGILEAVIDIAAVYQGRTLNMGKCVGEEADRGGCKAIYHPTFEAS